MWVFELIVSISGSNILSKFLRLRGWSGGAMVLGKLSVPGRPTIWITVGQGPTALVVGVVGVVWTFLLSSILFSSLSPSLWETARYRLKYCLKGPLSPKQPTKILRLRFTVSHFFTGSQMLIFGSMLVSWTLNCFCLLIYRKLFLLLSTHVSGK